VIDAIEHAIQVWASSGAVTNWINWHALKSGENAEVPIE
jgi:hypothetical protein